ncbi:MAG: DNA replication/repair protein RecF [Acidimicrobiales bacterium]
MRLRHLWLNDFRSFHSAELTLGDGITGIVGANGQGKTNLLEAIGWLATMRSFRGAPADALVRQGCAQAVIRAEVAWPDRDVLIEAELAPRGRSRVQINRQRLAGSRDLLGGVRTSVFAPDDLTLVKGGPAERRRYLDETLVGLHPRHDAVQRDVDRILAQRNALLRQVGGRLDSSAAFTLDVWDAKLAAAGETLTAARRELVERLGPEVQLAYGQLAGGDIEVTALYQPSWDGPLAAALAAGRDDDVRRGVTLVGPHRDELELVIDGLPGRTHGSQGEQRGVALALRLAAHRLVTTAVDTPPVLLLDDVFSELDPDRSEALLAHLPTGQTVLTSASHLPPGAAPEQVLVVEDGKLREV